jgi:hypothetical protein
VIRVIVGFLIFSSLVFVVSFDKEIEHCNFSLTKPGWERCDYRPKTEVAKELVFSGRIVEGDGARNVNDYLAVLFLDGREVARAVSQRGEFPSAGFSLMLGPDQTSEKNTSNGTTDGIFTLVSENHYMLTLNDIIAVDGEFSWGTRAVSVPNSWFFGLIQFNSIRKRQIEWLWVDDFAPNTKRVFELPSKRALYELVVLHANKAALQVEFLEPNSLVILADGRITVSAQSRLTKDMGNAELQLVSASWQDQYDETLVDNRDIDLNACANSGEVKGAYAHKFEGEQEILQIETIGIGLRLPITRWTPLVPHIEQTIGTRSLSRISETMAREFTTAPGKREIHRVSVVEKWRHGVATLRSLNTDYQQAFKVRIDRYLTAESIPLPCDNDSSTEKSDTSTAAELTNEEAVF